MHAAPHLIGGKRAPVRRVIIPDLAIGIWHVAVLLPQLRGEPLGDLDTGTALQYRRWQSAHLPAPKCHCLTQVRPRYLVLLGCGAETEPVLDRVFDQREFLDLGLYCRS